MVTTREARRLQSFDPTSNARSPIQHRALAQSHRGEISTPTVHLIVRGSQTKHAVTAVGADVAIVSPTRWR